MRKMVWPFIALGLIVWSGIAWLAHSLLQWGGNVASSNVDLVPVDPETVELFSWLAVFGTDVLQWAVIGVWGLGVALALGLGFLGQKALPRLQGLGGRIKP